jgi:hypothetical protein
VPRSHDQLRPDRKLIAVLVLIASSISIVLLSPPTPGLGATAPPRGRYHAASTGTATQTAYIPLVMRNRSAASSTPEVVFGTQFAPFQEEYPALYEEIATDALPLIASSGFSSIRTHLYWRVVERENTTPEAFNWSYYDDHLADYRAHGLEPMLSIVAYPKWAMRFACGGGLREGMDAEWREFIRAAARRYSQPPYRVRIWEIGNEVDGETEVDPEDMERPPLSGRNEPTWHFGGCWGDMAGEYVDFLHVAYEEIKAADPDAIVTLGGLAYTEFDHWFIRDFFSDFLAAGGGAYTDVVGFHWFPGFQAWPHALGKARELKQIMSRHGVDKPLWLTETYFADKVRDEDTGDVHDRRAGQYEFLTQEVPAALGTGEIDRFYWFSFTDWPATWSPIDRGLIGRDFQPKPGLKVFQMVADVVHGVASPVTLPGVAAYRFRQPGTPDESWVLWAVDEATVDVTLPTKGAVTAFRIDPGPEYANPQAQPVAHYPNGNNPVISVDRRAVFVDVRRGTP